MASTIVEFPYYTGRTLTSSIFPLGSDTADQSSMSATEQTNRKGVYRITVTAASTGVCTVIVFEGGVSVAVYPTESLADDTGTYQANDSQATASVSGTVDANLVSIDSVAQSMTDLKAFADNCYDPSLNRVKTDMVYTNATVNDVSATTTSFVTTITILPTNALNDLLISFTSGTLIGQTKPIASYDTGTDVITVSEAFTEAPANGDAFDIIRIHVHSVADIQSGLALEATAQSILTDTETDIPAAIAGIGTAGGAAISVDATTDNSAGGITGVTSGTTKVGTETGTFANTSFVNATYHLITHDANAIDWVYQFLTGGGTSVVSATWTGYLTSSNDTITFYAWNHVGGAWEAIGTQAGQAGSTNVTKTLNLYARHRGTSAAELGKVYIRTACTGMTSPVLRTDALSVSYSVTSRSVGYANGSVWIDTTTGIAGTESFVNGVADNPVLTLADALTIATAVGLRKFEIGNGSTITLAATTSNKVFAGHEWTLALGGQDVSSTMFIDAGVSGIGTGTLAEFEDCQIGNVTLNACQLYRCSLTGTFTVGATGDYLFVDCCSQVAGTGAPVLDMAAVGTTTVSFRRWSGGLTINNIASGDVISVDVVSGGTITLNGADGNVQVRGMCNIVDNRTGSPTLGTTNNMDTRLDTIDTNLATAQADLDILTGSDGAVIASGTQTFNMTGDVTGNLSGSVGSVTGAVGSVAGNVDGNVTGTVGSVVTKTGYSLAATGLDSITATTPAGLATTFPTKMMQLWARFFNRVAKGSLTMTNYADDGTTPTVTQTYTTSGTDTTDDVGGAS